MQNNDEPTGYKVSHKSHWRVMRGCQAAGVKGARRHTRELPLPNEMQGPFFVTMTPQ